MRPTVYDRIHIGNGRAFTVADLLVRVLRHRYGADHVRYVRNITDIDDKINARAKERGIAIADLTSATTAMLHQDLAALNVLMPDVEPRATDHIPEMIALIETLIAKGHAYVAEGHVLFDVPSFSDYGALSRRSLDDMLAGARIEVAPYKRDAMDFVLWKPSSEDLPGWPSPWGRGRPGWHLECSAMAEKHLGAHFDLHGGGIDLQFPHHENERAQSICAHGGPFVETWFHNGFLTVDAEKCPSPWAISRPLAAALERMPGEAVRYALLMAHYRQPADWSDAVAAEAKTHLDRWYRLCEGVVAGTPDAQMVAALEDDLNTPRAFSELHRLAQAAGAGDAVGAASLKASAQLMGFLSLNAEAWFRWAPAGAAIDPAWVETRIAARKAARAAKDFATADHVRKELLDAGVVLEDGPQGTTWRMSS